MRDRIDKLINDHLDVMKKYQEKYGGIYIQSREDGKKTVFKAELDDGELLFSETFEAGCLECGHDSFTASQIVRVNIVVDSQNNFMSNQGEQMEDAVYDAEEPFGPYSCMNCDEEYDCISEVGVSVLEEKISDIISEKLSDLGINRFYTKHDFNLALEKNK